MYADLAGDLTPFERRELRRRRSALLLYLARSPFYDALTKQAVLAAIGFAKQNVPLGGTVAELILKYLPQYRQIYSYLWSK